MQRDYWQGKIMLSILQNANALKPQGFTYPSPQK